MKLSRIFYDNAVEVIKGYAKMSSEMLMQTVSAAEFYTTALDGTFGLPDNEAKEELFMLSKKARSIGDQCRQYSQEQKSWDAVANKLNPKQYGQVRGGRS